MPPPPSPEGAVLPVPPAGPVHRRPGPRAGVHGGPPGASEAPPILGYIHLHNTLNSGGQIDSFSSRCFQKFFITQDKK